MAVDEGMAATAETAAAPAVRIDGALLARNTLLNLLGQVIPLGVAVVCMPIAILGLGPDAFGVLSLAWMVLGYFGIFDLGLGRATTKFVAEYLGRGERERIPELVWTSVAFQAVLGVTGGAVLAALTPFLVTRVLKIPPGLLPDARITFYLLAASAPVVLITATFRGVLEAAQRFDLVNAVKVPASSLTYLIPMLALSLGLGLPYIVALLMVARLAAAIAYAALVHRSLRRETRYGGARLSALPMLLGYGGWVTVSNVVTPVLVYSERALIAALVGVAAVGYYTVPYEMISRLTIVATSLATALFPAFSGVSALQPSTAIVHLYRRSTRYLLLAVGPLVVVAVVFGREVVGVWLGDAAAAASAPVFQVLAVGVLANSIAQVPFGLIQGMGRPDWTAKAHVVETLLYIPLAWLLVRTLGLVGGALAWTIRVTLDMAMLLYLARILAGPR